MSVKNRFVTIALVCVVALVGWFGLVFRPAHTRLGALRANVDSTRLEVSKLESQLQRLTQLKRNEPKVRAQAKRMTVALPTLPNVSDFIIQVQDAANASGIDFLSIAPSLPAIPTDIAATTAPATAPTATPNPGNTAPTAAAPAAPTSPLRSIAVQLTADGKFFEVEQFVWRLEHLARAVKIDDLTLGGGSQDQSATTGATADRVSASMKVQMFMLAPQAAAPVAPGSATQTGPGGN